jgi:hypothetical protein
MYTPWIFGCPVFLQEFLLTVIGFAGLFSVKRATLCIVAANFFVAAYGAASAGDQRVVAMTVRPK